jgi:hypothetical protein
MQLDICAVVRRAASVSGEANPERGVQPELLDDSWTTKKAKVKAAQNPNLPRTVI